MRISLRFSLLVVLVGLILPVASFADPVTDYFTLTYQGDVITFSGPASPTPASYGEGYNFTFDPTQTINGTSTCPNTSGLEFYTNPTGGGGFSDTCISELAGYTDQGVQMFTGDVSAPTFTLGTYDFTTECGPGSLVISDVAPTPEPSSLILLGTGIVGIAGMARRRFSGRFSDRFKAN